MNEVGKATFLAYESIAEHVRAVAQDCMDYAEELRDEGEYIKAEALEFLVESSFMMIPDIPKEVKVKMDEYLSIMKEQNNG